MQNNDGDVMHMMDNQEKLDIPVFPTPNSFKRHKFCEFKAMLSSFINKILYTIQALIAEKQCDCRTYKSEPTMCGNSHGTIVMGKEFDKGRLIRRYSYC